MGKTELKLHAVVAPTQTVIASAYDKDGSAQACTLAFSMVSSHVPPCMTIAINTTQKRRTLQAILHSKAFVLGFPSTDQVAEADYLGVETGHHADKLRNIGYSTQDAQTVHAPIIEQMRLSLECELVHTVTVGSHTQLTGEVKRILADDSILNSKGKIELSKLQPIIYNEEQYEYLSIGEKVADAFRTGAELKKTFDAEQSKQGK